LRIAIVDTYYEPVLADLYGSEQQLAHAHYDQQLARLIDLRFGTADAYSRELRSLGHEAWDIIANCLPLQRAWIREHGGRALRLGSRISKGLVGRALSAQIEAVQPDVVYFQALSVVDRESLDDLRRRGIFLAGQIASALPDQHQLEGFDLILTSFPHWVERLRERGIDAEYLAIGFDTAVLDALRAKGVSADPAAERPDDLVFVGSVNPHVHTRRVEMLEQLTQDFGLAVWGYGEDQLRPDSPLRQVIRGHAWGLDMYVALSRARIALNAHIDLAEQYANNMRLFEATGVGALLVTEAADNLPDLFEPDEEVVAYRTVEELPALLHRWLEDEQRIDVAAAGQRRTLADHTYADRIRTLAQILENRVG
jgi:spore maturation protein CgeB